VSEASAAPHSAGDAGQGLLALSPAETEAAVTAAGGKRFHAKSIRRHVFERGVLDYAGMTDLSAALREKLSHELPILTGRELDRRRASDDTIKLLIERSDPRGRSDAVETVYIPSRKRGQGATLCVSTQVGCPVRCPFCASGKLGLERNLTRAEILEQYVRGAAEGPLSRTVVMGIGEPLLNLPALLPALEVVNREMGLGSRKITVSTVGFPERLRALADQKPAFQLAISLHTPDQEQRNTLVPAMDGVPIEEVLAAGDYWFEVTGREITYEYVLLGGVNDSPDHAAHLAERLRRRRATVNLIPYNPVPEDAYRRPHKQDVEAFRSFLEERRVVATVRWSRGLEAAAACGQLRQAHAAS
jgi:23S rRNA (adenine2503-C2)-methyltransferase